MSTKLRALIIGTAALVSGLAFFLTNLDSILERLRSNADDGLRAALAKQVEVKLPYYGNSWDGNVRPQMESYIRSFVFPTDSPGIASARNLLKMVGDRASPRKPDEYFKADNSFRAAMDTFRAKVRHYALTGSWPDTAPPP